LLEVKGLHVNYGKLQVLQGVNCQVREKDFVSIIGSNGTGKSTLLNTICGLVLPVAGKIIFRGRELNGVKPHQVVRQGIYQVAEGRKLFRGMTVFENLLIAGSNPRAKAQISGNLEKVFGLFPVLGDRRNQTVKTLSGGEQQMVAIGCGMMASPELLMLDEPSLGIAPLLTQEIFRNIRSLNQYGITILLLEQNVKKSLEVSNYAYVLERGQVVLEGISKELIQNPHIKQFYLGL
jgi:branched-chain amino acid transport system ATP-binding protein